MSHHAADRALMESSSPQRVIDALHRASDALRTAGVRHAIVGGLAVAAYGYGRSTRHVDCAEGARPLVRRHRAR